MSNYHRRDFLRKSAAAVGSLTAVGSLQSFLFQSEARGERSAGPGYGPLQATADEVTGLKLVKLPPGFKYWSFGWTGDAMVGGQPTPNAHDGMSVIRSDDSVLTLCRNHEVSAYGKPIGAENITYDAQGRGGCTLLEFDAAKGEWVSTRPGISGTIRNCAGGATPWGTWLTCEETVLGPNEKYGGKVQKYAEDHGWIFEVPVDRPASPVPLKDMGRFVHEAVAVDPDTDYVYETEDRGTAGFYRFVPNERKKLAKGGRLQMMRVVDTDDLRKNVDPKRMYDTTWVDIEKPERRHSPGKEDSLGVFMQGKDLGATTFARLEGCWYGNDRIYFVSTSGGETGDGQVFEYFPKKEQLRLVFESPSGDVCESPDNMTVSPRGGLVLCEDGGSKPQQMHGLTPDGQIFPFATNNIVLNGEKNGFTGDYRKQEWAGSCFSPDGKWLFANIQTPGLTLAITGPWEDGGL